MKKFMIFIGLIFIYAGCAEESSVVGPERFLPQIEMVWENVADTTHTIQFRTDYEGVHLAPFRGTETHQVWGNSDVEGAFCNREISFTILRNVPVTYSGTLVQEGRMELTSSEGALVLVRAN
jgi:hypothetical protein